MKPCFLFFLGSAVSLIGGCASPPFTTPDMIDDYKEAGQGISGRKPDGLRKVQSECWLEEVTGDTLKDKIKLVRNKLLMRSCTYAYYHDEVKAFKARSDQATLGFASVAAIGAATNSNSEFVKSMVGFMGLSGATRVYVNPNVQMNVYMKSAIATQCMVEVLEELEIVAAGNGIPTSRSVGYRTIDSVASGLNYIRYHPEIYPSLFSVSPSLGIEFVGLTANPDQDAANKKAAIDFLFNVRKISNKNLRLIHGYIESTLNAQAFNVENSVRVIPATPTPKPGTGSEVSSASTDAVQKANALDAEEGADVDVNRAHQFTQMSTVLSKMRVAVDEDEVRPYADLIRANNDYSKCMAPIVGSSE